MENETQEIIEVHITNDYNELVSAVLFIPATMLVICFFSIIYKMFMNRKMRG